MKRWLVEQFLPMWAKESVLRDNRAMHRQIRQLQTQLQIQKAYIQGLESGLKAAKKIQKGGNV